ncbi:MAG: hypothetical protein LUI87_03430 [Lachnospiraceae bacterium]|nr:hypothetical protein [Lachnospiraceae bacterium]
MGRTEENLDDMSRYRILSLKKLLSNGIVCEDYSQFKNSVFSSVYDYATKLTEEIILANREYARLRNRWNTEHNSAEFELSNIISFVGRRGTGKSSSMNSFAMALRRYSGGDKTQSAGDIRFREELQGGNLKFHVLDCIDASELEESEDIFALILANMYAVVQARTRRNSSKLNGYDNRMLFDRFDRVYEDFVSLNQNVRKYEGYSTFEKLKNLASSQKLRGSFEDLVHLYLETLEGENDYAANARESYLVIMIDDLDMAKQKKEKGVWNWGCYKIMNCIYKYLTVPGVIVMTTYNEQNLYNHCVDYFKEQYDEGNEGVRTIASQFVEKTFPIFTRLYMPEWNNKDLENEKRIRIELEGKGNVLKPFQEQKFLSIKEFSLAFLGERTGIYFDWEGKKRHFFMPRTLRALYNVSELLMEMEAYDHALPKREELEKFEKNIERMKEDFYFRFVHDKLNRAEEYQMFRSLQEYEIDRRAEMLVQKICRKTIPLSRRLRQERPELVADAEKGIISDDPVLDNSRVPYSYAELVHSLYHMTRENGGYSRNLVSCILYSFTIYLTGTYRRYQFAKSRIGWSRCYELLQPSGEAAGRPVLGERETEFLECHQILKGMIGRSVCGKWAEYLFPEVIPVQEPSQIQYGQRKEYIVGYVDNNRISFDASFEMENAACFYNELRRFLFLCMLHTDTMVWPDEDMKCERIENRLEFSIKEEHTKGDFELTAFLKYTFCYAEFLGKIERMMNSAAAVAMETEPYAERRSLMETAMQTLRDTFGTFREEFYSWEREHGSFMLPLYNLDLTYNLIKRVFQECRAENMPAIVMTRLGNSDSFITAFKRMLERFCEHLKTIDSAYRLTDTAESFEKAFRLSPFYQWLLDMETEGSNGLPPERTVTHFILENVMQAFNDETYLTSVD